MTTDDNKYTYVFQILDGDLCFNSKQSSELTKYEGKTPIDDGAKFILSGEK